MPYYLRFFSPSKRVLPLDKIQAFLKDEGHDVLVKLEGGTNEKWDQFCLSFVDGREIVAVERNPVDPDTLGSGELQDFIDGTSDCKPDSAAIWLREYLPRVKTIYAIQFLPAMMDESGREPFTSLQELFFSELGGIIHADGEGFSNEDGYHISWEFSHHVKGPWWMGALRDGKWVHFQMELGNRQQRQAFLRGEVPPGVKLAQES